MTQYTKNLYLIDELWVNPNKVDGFCDEKLLNSQVGKQLFGKTDFTKLLITRRIFTLLMSFGSTWTRLRVSMMSDSLKAKSANNYTPKPTSQNYSCTQRIYTLLMSFGSTRTRLRVSVMSNSSIAKSTNNYSPKPTLRNDSIHKESLPC
jgi:hypothetical protein